MRVPLRRGGLSPSTVLVPLWVAHAGTKLEKRPQACGCTRDRPCKDYCRGLLDAQPRFHMQAQNIPPPGFYSANMYRTRQRPGPQAGPEGVISSCQVRHSAYVLHKDLDDALRSFSTLLSKTEHELAGILDDVGMNASMGQILKDSALAWDWSELIFARPTAEHVVAFKRLNMSLGPLLKNGEYPNVEPFLHVEKSWPQEAEMCAQYVHLASRIRAAYDTVRPLTKPPPLSHPLGPLGAPRRRKAVPESIRSQAFYWVHIQSYVVQPVWAHESVLRFCSQWGLGRGMLCKICASLVSLCLGGLPVAATTTFRADARDLWAPGTKRLRRSKKRPEVERVTWGLGNVATIRKHSLVRIVWIVRTVDCDKVVATLFTNSWFAVGGNSRDIVTWHACKVALRCSVMFPPEAPCERIGSIMRFQWESRQKLGPVAVADRVFLSQAGVECLGSDRDEMLVEVVASLVETTSKNRVASHVNRSQGLPIKLQERNHTVEASGRFFAALPLVQRDVVEPGLVAELRGQGAGARRSGLRERARGGAPSDLPASLAKVVHRASHGGYVTPLPLDVLTLHAEQRGATRSVTRARARSWLESDAGRDWMQERSKIFQADDPEPLPEDTEAACPHSKANAPAKGSLGSAKKGKKARPPKARAPNPSTKRRKK